MDMEMDMRERLGLGFLRYIYCVGGDGGGGWMFKNISQGGGKDGRLEAWEKYGVFYRFAP